MRWGTFVWGTPKETGGARCENEVLVSKSLGVQLRVEVETIFGKLGENEGKKNAMKSSGEERVVSFSDSTAGTAKQGPKSGDERGVYQR